LIPETRLHRAPPKGWSLQREPAPVARSSRAAGEN
jgi:hypothetical protein